MDRHPLLRWRLTQILTLRNIVVEAINVGYEIWKRIQFRFCSTPIIIFSPIVSKLLDSGQLNTLGRITNRFTLGPSGCLDALTEIVEFRITECHFERSNGACDCVGGSKAPVGRALHLFSISLFAVRPGNNCFVVKIKKGSRESASLHSTIQY